MAKKATKRQSDVNDYETARDYLLQAVEVLDALIEHPKLSERLACQRGEINPVWLDRFVNYGYEKMRPCTSTDRNICLKQDKWETWEEKFLRDLTGATAIKPKEFDKIFADKLTKLSKKEQDVIRMHYVCGMTVAEIGALKGVSASAVRNTKERAMGKLRRPENRQPLCYGYEYQKIKEELESVQLEYDKAYEEQQKMFIEKGKKIMKELQLQKEQVEEETKLLISKQDDSSADFENFVEILRNTPLEEMGFSTRVYRALYSYLFKLGYDHNAAGVASLHGCLDKVGKTKKIGAVSISEIVSVMKERFGIDMLN